MHLLLLGNVAMQLVVADFVRQNHVLPNIIQIGVEENKAVAPLAEVHTQKFREVFIIKNLDVELLGHLSHIPAANLPDDFLGTFMALF